MKKRNFKFVALGIVLFGLSGCMEKDVYDAERVQKEIAESFDYTLTTECPVTLQYERKALVEIYDANPLEDARARKLYAAFTDDRGHYTGTMVIPKAYVGKTVYARSSNIGVSYLLSGTVTEGGLDIKSTATRGIVPRGKAGISGAMLDAIERELPEGTNNSAKLGGTNDINLKVSKDCTIDVTFVWGGAGCDWWTGHWEPCQRAGEKWVNNDFACNLYYFVYSEGNLPTREEIQEKFINEKYLVMANANQNTSQGLQGTTVRLTTPDGDENIKAGMRIGWVITHPKYEYRNQWNPGEPSERIAYVYSIPEYNVQGKSQSIRYQYGTGDEKVILYGMEDLPAEGIKIWGENWGEHEKHLENGVATDAPFFMLNSDLDYNDILLTIQASPMDAIIEDDIPVLPDEPATPVYTSESDEGTLLFEDLYPSQGDYDMNDVVLKYELTKYFDSGNNLVKLGYKFIPVWDGASYDSGFGFMIDGFVSTPVRVFESHKNALNQTFEGEVTGNLAGKNKDDLKWDAFNPFIYVKDTDREVHLTRKAFSSSANLEGLDEYQKHYVNKSGYPFAMKIPTLDFSVVTERVRIDEEYPDYTKWVESNGELGLDWYEHKNK